MVLKQVLRKMYRQIKDGTLELLHLILSVVPKQKDLIVLTSWFGQRYADNTMYLYEYLIDKGDFKAVWLTKNKDVYKTLKAEKKPVYLMSSLKGKWCQLRAKVLVSTVQLFDFDQRFLTNCVYLDLDHGFPFKQAGYAIVNADNTYLKKHDAKLKKRIRFYLTATSYPCAVMLSRIYDTPIDQILFAGKPRDDLFFDKQMISEKCNEKFLDIIKDKKIILYMPTHRNCGKERLNINDHFDFDFIEQLCVKNGYLFLIKKHFYHSNEKVVTERYHTIIDITDIDIDSQVLLYYADILITDYSSVCPEFLLLEKPIILYPYDLDHFLEYDRDMFIPIDKMNFVDRPRTAEEINKALADIVGGSDDYYLARKGFRKLYFEEKSKYSNSREKTLKLIKQIINDDCFKYDWTEQRVACYKDEQIADYVAMLEQN